MALEHHGYMLFLVVGVACVLQGCENTGGILTPEGTPPTPTPVDGLTPGGAPPTPAPLTPLPQPSHEVSRLFDDVQCSNCEVVMNRDAGGHTCGARINWLKEHGSSEHDATIQVCVVEFPVQCGGCCGSDATASALRDVGNPSEGVQHGSLQLCQGDCDKDDDCAGSLRCFQRNGQDAVPGCSGSGTRDFDYCYASGGMQTPVPAPTPSIESGCCGTCATQFCSPVSNNCYDEKRKDYYLTCSGDTSTRRRRSGSCADDLTDYHKSNAACIVVKDGKVLLVKADYFSPSGSWDLPGGERSSGEFACQTAERETCEEGQIDVRAMQKTSVSSVFLCEYLGPTRKGCHSPEVITNRDWFSLNELPPLRGGNAWGASHEIRKALR